MKKRSKLDISGGVEKHKAQAAGFEKQAPEDPAPGSGPDPEPRAAEQAAFEGGSGTRQATGLSGIEVNGSLIIKAVAAVAVAALSVYLFKRMR
jgi:hypothetical protein